MSKLLISGYEYDRLGKRIGWYDQYGHHHKGHYVDQNLCHDIIYTTVFFSFMFAFALWLMSFNTPVDQCIEEVRTLSPYQQTRLVRASEIGPQYGEVERWCNANLEDHTQQITEARQLPQFPTY